VLKAFQLAEDMDASQNQFVAILQFGKEQYCKGCPGMGNFNDLWPRSWQSAIKMLEKQGYSDPEQYYVCLNSSHPCNYSVLNTPTAACKFCDSPTCTSPYIKYSYLPLRNKIRLWCSSSIFCHKMMAHWNEGKDHWLHNAGGYSVKKELWDGSRFAELSWFWDPASEWTLPFLCPFCRSVTCAATIDELAIGQNSSNITIQCYKCHSRYDYVVRKAKGDPRNIALLGHWDGWQPFSSSSHSSGMYISLKLYSVLCVMCMCIVILYSTQCVHAHAALYHSIVGAIEVSIATMSKQERSKNSEVYVCGFVPSHLLPNKRPNSLDPFLDPLIEEIKDLFVDGEYQVLL